MADQLIVNVTPFETRVALLEDGVTAEVFIERHRDRGIVGNIYLGKVQRVLPGMQAAFVEIGLDKAAFLYVGDVIPPEEPPDEEPEHAHSIDNDDAGETTGELPAPVLPGTGSGPVPRRPKRSSKDRRIEDVLKQGQEVLVQITKDAIGTKGPRVTCNISIPGRHLVYMPTHKHIGISRRITDEGERTRLRATLDELKPTFVDDKHAEVGGFVVRTVSEGLSKEKLQADMEFLVSLWRDVEKRAAVVAAPALVQPELDIVMRTARDLFTGDVEKLVIDDEATFKTVCRFVGLLDPELLPRVHHYKAAEPLFEHEGIETELSRAMSRKVWLKSGGTLIIDQAEALTAIDINTGRFVGKRNLEETIVKTNLEAVKEVAYQLRLRNIGGMVIVDFIDMEAEEHREKVLQALKQALAADRARCNVVKMSELGLVEMTRQRTRESLGRQLQETCWYCEGRGALKSKRTVVYEILRSLMRQAPRLLEEIVVVQAHPEVVDLMLGEEQETLEAVQKMCGRKITVRPRGSFHQEQYDIFGTSAEALSKKKPEKEPKLEPKPA
ncbi:MAG: Rne/Rng family ribonuclease [Deltaproteobacteria bacterium]|nr:Rne/Rng family ribonuclease [Deltaproteobacteria bacterium]